MIDCMCELNLLIISRMSIFSTHSKIKSDFVEKRITKMFRIFTKTLPSLASRGVVKNGGLVLRNGSCLDHSSNTLTTIRNFAEAPKQVKKNINLIKFNFN